MEHLNISRKLDQIATDNKEFFRIPVEQIANEVVQFCQENDVEPNSEEFVEIMNHMGLVLIQGMMMEWEFTKLKTIAKFNPPQERDINDD